MKSEEQYKDRGEGKGKGEGKGRTRLSKNQHYPAKRELFLSLFDA